MIHTASPADSSRLDSTQNPIDTASQVHSDTTTALDTSSSKEDGFGLKDQVDYQAKDTIIYQLSQNKVLLFGDAQINYQQTELKAEYIEFDMDDNKVFARGEKDSTGNIQGQPVFKDKDKTFNAKQITYNFKTEKGLINDVFTKEEGGYLHGRTIKRHANEHVHMKWGKYTTCSNKEHPHFYLAMSKAEVIPNDKIIAGPSYLVLEDIPLYFIGLPFGFFPNTNYNSSGVIIPEYGEEEQRGFFLKNMGYYFAINDYVDLTVTGDIYSNGTWGIGLESNYRKRYKYRGNVSAKYYEEATGEKYDDVSDKENLGNFKIRKDIKFRWRHSQASKAHPYRQFNANVDFSSTSYDQRYSYSSQNYLRNSKHSNISYHRTWPNNPFDFSANLRHSQNSQTQEMDLKLPQLALNMRRVYPFRSQNSTGNRQWYENIQVGYSAELQNNVNTYDSTLFNRPEEAFSRRNLQNGFQHRIPVSINLNPMQYVNISPQLNYRGVLYDRYINKYTSNYDRRTDSSYFHSVTDTIYKMRYGHSLKPSLNLSFNPKIYGMFQSINPDSKFHAMRHVMTPSFSFNYVPDISNYLPDYYKKFATDSAQTNYRKYSIFQRGIYGTPGVRGEQGIINFNLRNNLEMKVKNESDTSQQFNKIKIIDHLDFRTSYDVFADSMNLSTIRFSGGTRILDNNIDIQFNGVLDPYVYNKQAQHTVDQLIITEPGSKLARLTRFTASLSTNLNNKVFQGDKDNQKQSKNRASKQSSTSSRESSPYDYFNIKWNLRINYNLNYTKPHPEAEQQITQTLRLNGNLNLTDKWKIGFNSGYDFKSNSFTHTSGNIHRDLHCWEMRLNFSPFGRRKFYMFKINVKSSVLSDLKYKKRKNWRDY